MHASRHAKCWVYVNLNLSILTSAAWYLITSNYNKITSILKNYARMLILISCMFDYSKSKVKESTNLDSFIDFWNMASCVLIKIISAPANKG